MSSGPTALRIIEYRGRAENRYFDSLNALVTLDVPELAPAVNRLMVTHETLIGFRSRADAEIRQPRALRDDSTADGWLAAMQAYIDAVLATSNLLESSLNLADPTIDRLLAIKRNAWTARNHFGRIALRIETAVASRQPWSQGEIFAVAEDRGRAETAWATVVEAAEQPGTPPVVVDAVDAARRALAGPMAQQESAFIEELRSAQVPAIAVLELQKLNTALFDVIVEVANRALDEMVARALAQKDRARTNLALNGLMLAVTLGLTLGGFVIVQRRVSRPIRTMTSVMLRLADRDLTVAVPGVGRGDEIGSMAKAVQVFKDKMLTADRLAAELQDAQAELIESAKLAFLGSMVAGIAHEVNTPLGICITATSTADEVLADAEARLGARELTEAGLLDCFAKLRGSGGLVRANLARAAALIRRFKGVATDQIDETPRAIELGAQLAEIIASLRPELKRTTIDIRVRCPEPIEIRVLPGVLWQIVSNLVLNGVIHAFEPGAVGAISIEAARPSPEWVTISYADDGKGMLPEVRARIFEPFFTTRRGQGGTGLGLFITYKLVTQTLGGRIRCDSAPGRGTRFEIAFPATPPTAAAAPVAEALWEVPVP